MVDCATAGGQRTGQRTGAGWARRRLARRGLARLGWIARWGGAQGRHRWAASRAGSALGRWGGVSVAEACGLRARSGLRVRSAMGGGGGQRRLGPAVRRRTKQGAAADQVRERKEKKKRKKRKKKEKKNKKIRKEEIGLRKFVFFFFFFFFFFFKCLPRGGPPYLL